MQKLIDYFHNLLLNDAQMLDYLFKRDIDIKTINFFKLGKFPRNIKKIISLADSRMLSDSMILFSTKDGVYSEFMTNNLIIPIFNVYDEPIAFAGRTTIPEEERVERKIKKYWNNKYHKTLNLYGLNWSKDYIREADSVIVVEGYFDFISAFKHNIKNVVATGGTLLSNQQINLLSRYASTINLLYDNDGAGKKAAERALKKRGKERTVIKELFLHKFKDLDELVRSGEEVKKYISVG